MQSFFQVMQISKSKVHFIHRLAILENENDEGTGGTGGAGTRGDDGLDWQGDNNGGSPIYKFSLLPPLISIILLSI